MTNPERIKQILLSEIEKMDQHREDFCRHPGIDFTRDRKIPFGTLLHFQISMESGSVSHELLKYFNFDAQAPSLSAFYQQRAKLSDDVFQKLFYSFNRHFSPRYLLKGRYQLLACDGSGFTFTRNPKGQVTFVKQKRKHVHQVDFSIAFKTCRHFLRLHSGEAPPDVEGLIRKHTLPVRPSRNFARQQRFQVPVSFTYRF